MNPLKKFANRAVNNAFDFLMKVQDVPKERYKFYAIGNSHLDAAWRWRVVQTQSKAKHTFKNALRHIALHEAFTFSQSQPAFYEWMKDRHPVIFRAIQDQVKSKHWELVGGMWVEPDLNMPDGESLVRQRLYGQRFYLDHFGRISEVEWMPDTFGFAHSLPQIFAKSGAKYFWTSKLLWNDTTRFPFSTFKWKSPDGSEVLVNISPIQGLSFANMSNFKKRNRLVHFNEKLEACYASRPGDIRNKMSPDIIPEIGVFYGLGDGGGGPNEIEIEIGRILRERGVVEVSLAKDFFDRLAAHEKRLPVWNDELYLEYHRGCLTTQAWIKNANRRAEIALRNAEIIHSMNSLFSKPYPGEILRANWKILLFNQFHDILPGSSIPEVYEDARDDFDSLFASTYRLIQDGIKSIGKFINTINDKLPDTTPLIVYNPVSWPRSTTAFLRLDDNEKNVAVFDTTGRAVPSQEMNLNGQRALAITSSDVPDLGYRTYYMKPDSDDSSAFDNLPDMATVQEDGSIALENDLLKAIVDGVTGCVTSLVDKRTGFETLAGPANHLRLYRDESPIFPAWNIDRNYKKKEIKLDLPTEPPRIFANGPVAATVEVDLPLNKSEARARITIFRSRPLLMFEMKIDWHEKKAILKSEFNTSIKTETVASDVPYAAIERPTHPRYPAQKAQWELPCQKWIDLSDGRNGVALVNQDKYGFSVADETIALTLLRAPVYPKPIFDAWGLRPKDERPKYTDQGIHRIRYALYPHTGDWREGRVWQLAHEFCDTLLVVRSDHHRGILPREATALSCRSRSTYVGAIKRPEDNPDKADTKYHQIVVRLVEAAGHPDTVTLKFGTQMTITDVKETDLLEFSVNPIKGDTRDGEVDIRMMPHEIKTVKITLVENRFID